MEKNCVKIGFLKSLTELQEHGMFLSKLHQISEKYSYFIVASLKSSKKFHEMLCQTYVLFQKFSGQVPVFVAGIIP